MGEVAGDLGTGPVLGVDEFATEQAVAVDDVGFGDLGGAVELVDAAVGVADGGDLDVVIGEEAAVDVVGLIHGDADDGEIGHLFMELEQTGEFLDAGGAPGGPEVEDDGFAAQFGQVDALFAVRDGELRGGLGEGLWVVAAIATEREGEEGEEAGGDGSRSSVGHGEFLLLHHTKALDDGSGLAGWCTSFPSGVAGELWGFLGCASG